MGVGVLGFLPLLIRLFSLTRSGDKGWGGNPVSVLEGVGDDVIEEYLPQLCSVVVNAPDESTELPAYSSLESSVIDRCKKNFIFGLKAHHTVKASLSNMNNKLLYGSLLNTAHSKRSERINALKARVLQSIAQGDNLPAALAAIRSEYFWNCISLVELLTALSVSINGLPVERRHGQLMLGLRDVNALIRSRVFNRRFGPDPAFALHYPLSRCTDHVLRLVNVVLPECRVLPSRDRSPYLLTVEVIRQEFTGDSMQTYCQGELRERLALAQSKLNSTSMHNLTGVGRRRIRRLTPHECAATVSSLSWTPNYSGHEPGDSFAHSSSTRGGQTDFDTAHTSLPTFSPPTSWTEKKEQVKARSPFGHLPGWDMTALVVKAGADLQREALAMQFIEAFSEVFSSQGLDIVLRPYRIYPTGPSSGLVEYLDDALSVDAIKKCEISLKEGHGVALKGADAGVGRWMGTKVSSRPSGATLLQYFEFKFGQRNSSQFERALNQFIRSLVGYSLVTYALQVKDRHNGNILIDDRGRIIHIDFGFILGESPAFNMNFETAPFKMTAEYVELMGGYSSDAFRTFEDLLIKGFFAIKRNIENICAIEQGACGTAGSSSESIRTRFEFVSTPTDVQYLLKESIDNPRTTQYDWIQQQTNNIRM